MSQQLNQASLQDIQRSLRELEENRVDTLQQLLRTCPETLQRHGPELYGQLCSLCNAATGPARKLATLNAAWKALLTTLTAPQVTPHFYSEGVLFMLEQLKWGVLSHDWTEVRSIKLAAFFASHVVSAVRAHPVLFLTADSATLVKQLVELYYTVALTIATSTRDSASLSALHENILTRLESILESLGSAAAHVSLAYQSSSNKRAASTTLDSSPGAAAASRLEECGATSSSSCCVDLLSECVSQEAAACMEEAAGNEESVSMSTAAAAFGCVLHAAKGFISAAAAASQNEKRRAQEKTSGAAAAMPTAQHCDVSDVLLTVHALLQWLPGASLTYSFSSFLPAALEEEESVAQKERYGKRTEQLMNRIAEVAVCVPDAMFSPAVACEEGTLRAQFVGCLRDAFYYIWETDSSMVNTGDPAGRLVTGRALSGLLTALATPHPQSATLVLDVWMQLSDCIWGNHDSIPAASAAPLDTSPWISRQYSMLVLQLVEIGQAAFNQLLLVREAAATDGEKTVSEDYNEPHQRRRSQAALVEWTGLMAVMIGFSCAVHLQVAPSSLLASIQTEDSGSNAIIMSRDLTRSRGFSFLADVAYSHLLQQAQPLLPVMTSDDCASSSSSTSVSAKVAALSASLHALLAEVNASAPLLADVVGEKRRRESDAESSKRVASVVSLLQLLLQVPCAMRALRLAAEASALPTMSSVDDEEHLVQQVREALAGPYSASLSSLTKILQRLVDASRPHSPVKQEEEVDAATSSSLQYVCAVVARCTAALLLTETAHIALDAESKKDEVMLACVRRWVDIGFSSDVDGDGESTRDASAFLNADVERNFYRLRTAKGLLAFAEYSVGVPMDKLRLSEEAAVSLVTLIQGASLDTECEGEEEDSSRRASQHDGAEGRVSRDASAFLPQQRRRRYLFEERRAARADTLKWLRAHRQQLLKFQQQQQEQLRKTTLDTAPAHPYGPSSKDVLDTLISCQQTLELLLSSASLSIHEDDDDCDKHSADEQQLRGDMDKMLSVKSTRTRKMMSGTTTTSTVANTTASRRKGGGLLHWSSTEVAETGQRLARLLEVGGRAMNTLTGGGSSGGVGLKHLSDDREEEEEDARDVAGKRRTVLPHPPQQHQQLQKHKKRLGLSLTPVRSSLSPPQPLQPLAAAGAPTKKASTIEVDEDVVAVSRVPSLVAAGDSMPCSPPPTAFELIASQQTDRDVIDVE